MTAAPTPTPTPAPPDQAVRLVVAEADRLQSDPDGFAELLTEDVVVVNFGGRRVRGRAALHQAMTAALASPLADVTTRQIVDHVRFVRPDVALVECTKHVHDGRPGGAPHLAATGEVTFVLVRQHGRWRIASVQTTPVAA
jgi:uncharacterized protein (TIGR02246 family)